MRWDCLQLFASCFEWNEVWEVCEQEKTSDGRAVWLALTANHGGKERWEQCYAKLLKISSHIEKFRGYYP